MKPRSGNVYNFSSSQVQQFNIDQNKQKLYMSDLEFKPIHKLFRVTISSIKYSKDTNSDVTQTPFLSKFYPKNNQQRKHLKPRSGNVYNFSSSQVHQFNIDQNKQKLYMSDLEFKPIHKLFRVTISSIKYSKDTNSDVTSLQVHSNSPYKNTLPLGLLGCCETNATFHPTEERAFSLNIVSKLLDIFITSTINKKTHPDHPGIDNTKISEF